MLDWAFGFFPVLTMMAMAVMGILAARFIHVDKYYEEEITKRNNVSDNLKADLTKKMSDKESEMASDVELEGILDYLIAEHREAEMYKNYKNNNRNFGALIDGITVFALVAIGMSAIVGAGEAHVTVLAVFSFAIFLVPLLHFAYHKNIMKKSEHQKKERLTGD